MKRFARICAVLSAIVLIVISLVVYRGCAQQISATGYNKLPVIHMAGDPSIDVSDPAIAVAGADYVFAGYVDKMTGTQYRNAVQIETENGTKRSEDPYTKYSVAVLGVIKGNIQAGQDLPILKAGGISRDKSSVHIFDDDSLPDVGRVYIFMVYVQPDRKTLLVTGPYSSISLESTTTSAIKPLLLSKDKEKQMLIKDVLKKSNVYMRYVDGEAKHAVVPALPAVRSVYEK